jgi:sulfite exporter TauE/SafE
MQEHEEILRKQILIGGFHMKKFMKMMYLIACAPLFTAGIAMIMLGIVTLPLLLLASIISRAMPSDFGNRFFQAARETYMFPAYCLRDAGEFIDSTFRKWTNANN